MFIFSAKIYAKRIVVSLAILLATLSTTKAQLLWEISGNGVNGKSYLIATDMLTDISFLDTIPNVFRLFGKSQNVILEMSLNDSLFQHTLITNALLPDTLTLKKLYNPTEYAELSEASFLYLNMPVNHIDKLKPVYVNELLRNQILTNWAGYDEQRSTAFFFQSLALQTNKSIIGLDDIGETMYIMFEREPLQWQTQELLRTIQHPEREVKQQKAITQLYKAGKLNQIADQIAMPDNRTSISYSDYKVYCSRNKEWVKKLTPYLKDGNQFIALNCIYLGGDEGLIAQLRKAGYKVKPYNKRQ